MQEETLQQIKKIAFVNSMEDYKVKIQIELIKFYIDNHLYEKIETQLDESVKFFEAEKNYDKVAEVRAIYSHEKGFVLQI